MYIGFYVKYPFLVGRNCSVDIATRHELDGPGIKFWWGRIFRTRPDRPWVPPSLLYSEYRVSFPDIKRPGRGVDHPSASCTEGKLIECSYQALPLSTKIDTGNQMFVLRGEALRSGRFRGKLVLFYVKLCYISMIVMS
jgi:hypothetical protein